MSHNYAKLLISGGSAGPVNSLHNIDVACEASSSRAAGGAQTARFCAFFRQTIKKGRSKNVFFEGSKKGVKPSSVALALSQSDGAELGRQLGKYDVQILKPVHPDTCAPLLNLHAGSGSGQQ